MLSALDMPVCDIPLPGDKYARPFVISTPDVVVTRGSGNEDFVIGADSHKFNIELFIYLVV